MPNPVRSNQVCDAIITVAQVGTTDDFTITIQLLGVNGEALTAMAAVQYYFSIATDGTDIAVTSTDVVSVAIGTDGLCLEDNVTGNVYGWLVSESDGAIDLAVEVADDKTVTFNLILPDGTIITGDEMAYTA